MRDEKILDSGQIYSDSTKDWKQLSAIEFKKYKNVNWTKVTPGTKVKRGGNQYITHRLVGNKTKIRFIPFRYYIAGGCFLSIGIPYLILGFIVMFTQNLWIVLLIFFIGFAMTFVGIYLINRFTIIVFDKQTGKSWKGKSDQINLEHVKLVQLIREYVSTDSLFYSYEINLVLHNEDRINIVDHGNQKAAIKDAIRLAMFLDVPLIKLNDTDQERIERRKPR